MNRREKQQKFHQAIIDMLYPQPPQQEEEEEDLTTTTSVGLDVTHIPDPENFDSPPSSSDNEDDQEGSGSHKLTRAQRKRLRKKKLKESASSAAQRRKVIGPLLPSTTSREDGGDEPVSEYRLQGVRQNAAESQSQATPPNAEDCNAQKEGKLKRRRMAKKLGREKMKSSHLLDRCDKDGDSCQGNLPS